MWIRTEAFHVPKHGNAEDEYEDAYFPDWALARELSAFRCAVADGASESAYAAVWAQLLVRGFGRRRLHLDQLRRLWQRTVKGKPLPWYLEKKIGHGAHAALVGLAIRDGKASGNGSPGGGGTWRAVAVGDSCIFQARGDELVTVGPLTKSEQFDNSPFLLASKAPQKVQRSAEYVTVLSGPWQSGDTFLLATDALAKWMLTQVEAGKAPWSMLRALGDETFGAFINKLRSGDQLNNDDTTLMRVEVA